MKRLFILGGLIGAFLLSFPAFGDVDDGRECQDSADADIPLGHRSGWIAEACVQLCDTKKAADSYCTEWDFNDVPGMPEIIVFEYEENDGGCNATPDFTITTGPISNGGTAAAGDPAYDIGSTALILNSTTNRIVIITEDAPPDRFLFTAIGDDTNCTDVDIRMFFYNRKKGMF
jgi:hypothetical protein